MEIPANNVPKRAAWQKLRDKSGGKKGLSKVSIGKLLDAFHGAVAKASSKDDLTSLNKSISALDNGLNSYIASLSKDKQKYNELISTVRRELKSPLDKFVKALEQKGASESKKLNDAKKRVYDDIKAAAGLVDKECKKAMSETEAIYKRVKDMQVAIKEEIIGVTQKPTILKYVAASAKKLDVNVDKAKALDKILNDKVHEHARDYKDVIKSQDSALGKCKGSVKELKDLARKTKDEAGILATTAKKLE